MANRSFWQGRPVFVTGGTGLLGGWLVSSLVDLGAEVVVLVRNCTARSMVTSTSIADRVSLVVGDLQDTALIRRTMTGYSVDTVFHLAAQAIVGKAATDPISTLEVNVRGTWNLLDASRQCGVKQVLVASSGKAYGSSPDVPYTENTPLQGRHPYDVSKSCADLISTMFALSCDLPVSIVRCANLFGGADMNFSRMIPDLIRATLRGEPFEIRSDGRSRRDFLYVRDAVEAYLSLAEALAGNRSFSGEAFNFGLERQIRLLDLVRTVLDLMGRSDLQPTIRNSVNGEIQDQYLCCERARKLLGWEPAYTLEQGLIETIAWYRAFFQADVAVPASALATA